MNRLICILLLTIAVTCVASAEDMVILRNGDEVSGKLSKISDKEIAIVPSSGSLFFKRRGETLVLPSENVYMVKTEKRGSTFFINGKRVIRETIKHDKSADYIYLISGEEIPAWQVYLDNGIISYQKNKEKKRAMSNIGAYPIEEVFMIKYSDGSKDMFTELPGYTPTAHKASGVVPSSGDRQLKVIFHNVLLGESLGNIAEKYQVTVDEIKEWNELPSRSTHDSKPQAGTQLMIQVSQ